MTYWKLALNTRSGTVVLSKVAALLAAALVSSTTGMIAATAPAVEDDNRILHLLNRVSYGAGPEDLDYVRKIGTAAFIEEQLSPEKIELPKYIEKITDKPALTQTPVELFMNYGKPVLQQQGRDGKKLSPQEAKDLQKRIHEVYRGLYDDVTDARLSRAVYSPRQLQEVMTEFWYNHFNVYANKGLDNIWTGSFEQTAIRPNALGKFRQLLGATAHHPAMLFYLDNWQNSKPGLTAEANPQSDADTAGSAPRRNNPKAGNNKFAGLNENYARELMELHTLGVDGGYSQKDVMELARVLTGLGLPPRGALMRQGEQSQRNREIIRQAMTTGCYFDPQRHDFGQKVLLGSTIAGSGQDEIEKALDLLAAHPSTARFISFKLAQFFVCDKPPETLVKALADRFKSTGGDIKEVMRTLLSSKEFWDSNNTGSKYKSPYRYVVSAVRATGGQVTNYRPMLAFLRQSGMPLYQCVTPDGYKCVRSAWLDPDGIIKRINFATGYGVGRMPGMTPTLTEPQSVIKNSVGTLSAKTSGAISAAPSSLRLSLVLGSPEFMTF